MKLTTKMFLTLTLTVGMMAAFQYSLVQIRKDYIKDYAASFGGKAVSAGGGFGFLSAIFKKKAKPRPKSYKHENFYCGKNVCSFIVKSGNFLAKPVTVVIDIETLAKECIAQDRTVSEYICKQFEKGGWDIIRQ